MTDEERIEMYYKFGLADWRSELSRYQTKTQKPAFRWTLAVRRFLEGVGIL